MTNQLPAWTLAQAKQWLRDNVDEGARCPCCGQFAKIYRRRMTATTARAMIAMHRYHDGEFVHLPTLVRQYLPDVAHQGGYATLAGYWNLIEEERDIRRDDGGRVGWWRLTDLGRQFVQGHTTAPRWALIYDGRLQGFDGDMLTIFDALGAKFDYNLLMKGAA